MIRIESDAGRRRPARRPESLHRRATSSTTTGAPISSRRTSARKRSRSTSRTPAGRRCCARLIRTLDVDVFCCNTLPRRYQALGIDYETLARGEAGPDLGRNLGHGPGRIRTCRATIRCSRRWRATWNSPAIRTGPPTLTGVPLVDLKAGDEVYANVMLALAERAETGRGRRIDVSMLQAAASWLITTLPLVDFDCEPAEITRAATSTASSSRPTSTRPATASSSWPSAATCSGSG